MKRHTNVRHYLLMISASYARGWEQSVLLFDAVEQEHVKKKKYMLRVA